MLKCFIVFQSYVLCRRCINLLDRADHLKVNITLMKEELDELTDQMMTEMNGKKSGNSASGAQIECPFSCKNARGNLFRHLNEEHPKDFAFVCSACNDQINGGMKHFILHQILYHPGRSITHLLGSIIYCSGDTLDPPQRVKEPNSRAICPYCNVSVHFLNEKTLRAHLESLHRSMLETDIHAIISSMKFTSVQQGPQENKVVESSKTAEKHEVDDENKMENDDDDLIDVSNNDDPTFENEISESRQNSKTKGELALSLIT